MSVGLEGPLRGKDMLSSRGTGGKRMKVWLLLSEGVKLHVKTVLFLLHAWLRWWDAIVCVLVREPFALWARHHGRRRSSGGRNERWIARHLSCMQIVCGVCSIG